MAITPVGREVKLTIFRQGKRKELIVKIGNLEEATKIFVALVKERLGAEVRSLNPKEAEKFALEVNKGVIISWINPKGPLGKAGFEVGDIILGINGQPINNIESFTQLVASLKSNQRITLLALDHRSGNIGYVQIEL